MTGRNLLLLGFVVVISALVGGSAGYVAARRQDADLLNAVRAVEFSQRLTHLRVMREHKVPVQTIESLEISAVVLLDTIALDAPEENAAYVLKNVAQNLVRYVHDFPESQLADRRHAKVTQLTAMANR